jgi:hypothetical protein
MRKPPPIELEALRKSSFEDSASFDLQMQMDVLISDNLRHRESDTLMNSVQRIQ